MYCKSCGKKIWNEKAESCPYCGVVFDEDNVIYEEDMPRAEKRERSGGQGPNNRRNLIILIIVICAAAAFVLIFALVHHSRQVKKEQQEVAEEVAEEELVEELVEEPAQELQEIGNPYDSKEIEMTNEMGGMITGLSVKSSDEDAYPSNMMKNGQTFADDETVNFFYEPSVEERAEELTEEINDDAGQTNEAGLTYSLQVTMENGDVYELSDFDLEDMEEVTLHLEDGVAYLEYRSISENILVSTKDIELAIKADKEAAQAVIDRIAAIGDDTQDREAAVTEAREAYDALTEDQKAYVTNLDRLEELEAAQEEALQEEAEQQAAEQAEDSSEQTPTEWEPNNAYTAGYSYGTDSTDSEAAASYAESVGIGDDNINYFWDGYYNAHSERGINDYGDYYSQRDAQ